MLEIRKVESSKKNVENMISEINSYSKKTGKESVFSITVSKVGKRSVPFIRQSNAFVIGNIETADLKEVSELIEKIDGKVDWIVLDESSSRLRRSGYEKMISKSKKTWYCEERVLRLSIYVLLSQKQIKGEVLLLSDESNYKIMKLSLQQQGIFALSIQDMKKAFEKISKLKPKQYGSWEKYLKHVSAIISFGKEYSRDLTNKEAQILKKDAMIYAACPQAFLVSFSEEVIKKGNIICRVDYRAALASELNLVIETKKKIKDMGFSKIRGVPVISGGIIGKKGSIVLDSLNNPQEVIGVADGLGGLLNANRQKPYLQNRAKVEKELLDNLYKKN